MYRNATYALYGILEQLMEYGSEVDVRGSRTKEILSSTIHIQNPLERCITVPYRRDNIFAKIAETMWVIAGKDDMEYLSHYLPRALEFSDNGRTWRGAYGPRLRNWNGHSNRVDQVQAVVGLLRNSPHSRRAVMQIFDPSMDYCDSKDIPCNNWIHWIIRNGKLDMNVAQRSSDAIWGFSGINTFEWGVLHQMMAYWVGAQVGQLHYFITSLHIYESMFDRAYNILETQPPWTMYDMGWGIVDFNTPFETFDPVVLRAWFAVERFSRNNPSAHGELIARFLECNGIVDPLLSTFALALHVHNQYTAKEDLVEISKTLEIMPDCDIQLACMEYISRKNPELFTLQGSERFDKHRNAMFELFPQRMGELIG